MVFNATFNNISVTSWRSDLLVEETLSHDVVSSSPFLSGIQTHNVSCDCTGRTYKSNYHLLTTTMTPLVLDS